MKRLLLIGFILVLILKQALYCYPQETNKELLLRWNLLGANIGFGTRHYTDVGTVFSLGDLRSELLSVGIFSPKYHVGVGTVVASLIFLSSDNMDTPERLSMGLFPICIYFNLNHRNWALSEMRFANTLNSYIKFGFPFQPSRMVDFGIDWTPGTLLDARAGYTHIFHESPVRDESSFYISLGLYLGGVNVINND